ncbi:hypothetical protein [Bombella sp. ESL0385]|uniref:hypothetical protein n=1 Tax=Bombella sp. ESL0385 TaxID=2676446 RepID=UPI001E3B0782|nr:hypothetical protein [Bombella sp. ESL0385]
MMDEADKEAQRAFITGIRGEVSEGEEPEQAATAKPGETGWVVRILDQSGASAGDDDVVEEVKGFLDLAHANAFARAYVRDSVERCRIPGAAERDVLESWFAFGENAEVVDAGEDGWKASTELDDFVSSPATPMERDWRALDPRRLVDEAALEGFSNTAHDDDLADEDDDEAFVTEIIRRKQAES